MHGRRSLERKLFGWLAALAVLPALVVLALTLAVGSRSLRWIGTLGPWSQVAESGRQLIDAAGRQPGDSVLAGAAAAHRRDLSASLVQANRWAFLGNRLAAAAPWLVGTISLMLVVVALLLSRRLSHQLARPINDLVDWAGRLGRGESLPPANGRESAEPAEVLVLRDALRNASDEIERGRRRALDVERTRAWGEMARRVAHEMKNPLTPLRLAAHRLDRAPGDAAELQGIASVIRDETRRLDELARSFAALGRPTHGPTSQVDLRELLQSLLETDLPGGVGHTLAAGSGTAILDGHHDALQRAFRNLLRNAVDAVQQTGRGGSIDVTIRCLADDAIEVVIADDGVGIPDGLTEAIFEPDRTMKAGGTGLGLAIVQQVVTAHGGSVTARNRDQGAEFIVVLPGERRGEAASNT